MSKRGPIAPFPLRKSRQEFRNAMSEVDGKAQNGAELDDDGVHLPVAVAEIDVKQRFCDTKVRRGTDGQKFGKAFDDSQYYGEQVVVQVASSEVSVSQKHMWKPLPELVLVLRVAIGGNALLDKKKQAFCACTPITLRELGRRFLGKRNGLGLGLLRFLGLVLGFVDFDQGGAPPGCIVERLGYRRGLGVLADVFLVDVSFFLWAFGGTLPVSAQLIIDSLEGCEVGPFGSRIFLFDQLHQFFIHAFSEVGFFFVGGRTRHDIDFFQLPANVGGAVESLRGERGTGKDVVYTVIETQSVLIGASAATATAGLVLGVNCFPE